MYEEPLVIGAPGKDVGEIDAGAVYLVEMNTGILQKTVVNPIPESGTVDLFGLSID